MAVRTFPRSKIFGTDSIYREIDADVYHSQEPSLSTFVAQRAVPQARHVVTARDPRDARDWWIEFKYPSRTRLGVLRTAAFYENHLTHAAVRRASRVLVPAKCLTKKVQQKYRLVATPEFMPTPITMPEKPLPKAGMPTICFVGRLDRRKQPDKFFALAAQFPEADFVVAGGSQDARYESELLARFGDTNNIRRLGFVDQFTSNTLSALFSEAWILVNTAAREGLPNVFIEAATHGCAIVSPHDPDGFASRFGWHCRDENFAQGVDNLLRNDRWRARGEAGAAYVRATNDADRATALHLQLYESALLDRSCA